MSNSVEFRHLEYLVAIDEGKNFTRAAEKLYKSQPAISQQVRGLEGLDRLTDQAHIIETGSESYRFRRTLGKKRKE